MNTVGLYAWPDSLIRSQGELVRLRDEHGLNLVILESHRSIRIDPELVARNPLGPLADRGPGGIRWSVDDGDLNQALEICDQVGLTAWLMTWGWYWDAERYPRFAVRDLWGRSLADSHPDTRLPFCPSEPEVARWFEDVYEDLVVRYPTPGLVLTHARYARPAFLDGLVACACDHCLALMDDLGLDGRGLVPRMQQLLESLARNRQMIRAAITSDIGVMDVLDGIEDGFAVVEWFDARCRVVSHQLDRFRLRVRAATGSREHVFAADWFPPTFGRMTGQSSAGFGGGDRLLVNLPWLDMHFTSTLVSFADSLVAFTDLPETVVLPWLYAQLGHGGTGLPSERDILRGGLESRPQVLESVVRREIEKAAVLNDDRRPGLIWLNAEWQGDVVRRLAGFAIDCGFSGVVYHQAAALIGKNLSPTALGYQ